MNPEVLHAKLESLSRCIHRIEDKSPSDLASLELDYDIQDIIVLNQERSVQLCVDIGLHILADEAVETPSSMSETFTAMSRCNILSPELAERMKRSVGFCNIAVHRYRSIDWAIVYSVITQNLNDFRYFAAAVMNLL